MEPMVAGIGQDIGWIEGIQLEVEDHWIHLTGGPICMGIILVPHLGDIITVITVIILIGGVNTYLRSSRKSSLLNLMLIGMKKIFRLHSYS